MNRVGRNRPSGFASRSLAVWLLIAGVVGFIGFRLLAQSRRSDGGPRPLVHVVTRGVFVREVMTKGTLESSNNVEITCRVRNRGQLMGMLILGIVPEGTHVEPGDLLVELDSTVWEAELKEKQDLWNINRSRLIGYQNELETAELTLRAYRKGTYKLQRDTLKHGVLEAELDQQQASEYFDNSRSLHDAGFVTELQLESDRTALEGADRELTLANMRLATLVEHDREKVIKTLEHSIASAQGNVRSRQRVEIYYDEKIAEAEQEVRNCTITAPSAGQVIYADPGESTYNTLIEEGAQVRNRQVIIHLPDPKRMQVKALISEEAIGMVKPGMPVVMKLVAWPYLEMHGWVEEMQLFPQPTSSYGTSVKQFETSIRIEDPPPDLAFGATADVRICVERRPDVLLLPAVSLLNDGEHPYCILRVGNGWQARRLAIGPSNGKFAIVKDHLQPGDEVVLNARRFSEEIDLPDG